MELSLPFPSLLFISLLSLSPYSSPAPPPISSWSVVCLSCPVCLCDVRALWPNGWTDQDETWHAGRPRPSPHCVRWGPSSPPLKGNNPPIFGPYLLRPNGCMDQDVTWYEARPWRLCDYSAIIWAKQQEAIASTSECSCLRP